jgi:hypothetical protein
MPTLQSASRNLSSIPYFSPQDHQAAERALAQREKRRRAEREATQRKLEAATDSAWRRLRELLSNSAWAKLRGFMREESVSVLMALQPPRGLGLDRQKVQATRLRRADAFLRKLGASSAKLRALGRDVQAELQELLPAPPEKAVPGHHLVQDLKSWKKLSPLNEHALPWGDVLTDFDEEDPHRWHLFQPPFWGFDFGWFQQNNDNFHVDRLHYLEPASGLVGNQVTMDISTVDDFDYCLGQADSLIAVAFTAPTTGVIEVLIDAQSLNCVHSLRTEDRWGWSDSTTSQINYLMLDVLHPNVFEPSLAEMSRFRLVTDDDTNNHVERLIRGQHYYAQLFSSGPVQGGQTVIIEAGTRNFDKSGANDVEIHSLSNFQWFISSVQVRISP